MGGVLAKMFLRDLNRFPPLPVKDPRLSEALGLYIVPVPGQCQDADGQLPGLEPASEC